MKIVKIVGIVVGGLIALVLLLGNLLPRDYQVERSVEIAAPPERVFAEINSLKKWGSWSPWLARDKTINNTYSGPDEGVGAKVSWTSEHSGEGSQTITKSEPNESVETNLDFGGMGSATAYFRFSPAGSGTRVVWGMRGEASGPVGGLMATQMDGFVGPDYEDGLARLKRHLENP